MTTSDFYRIPDDVIAYIYEHNLYRHLDMHNDSKGKDKTDTNGAVAGPTTG